MKKIIHFLFIALTAYSLNAQTAHTITASGVEYTPDTITVNLGDTIKFDVGSSHPTTEVDLTTYNANGSTPLSGGFSFPTGQGFFVTTTAGQMFYICDNHISQGMKGMIVVIPNVGISEVHLGEHTLYPNPVEDELHLDLEGPQHILIYSLDGKIVEEIENSETTIKVAHLNSGTYILVIGEGQNMERIRFIKK